MSKASDFGCNFFADTEDLFMAVSKRWFEFCLVITIPMLPSNLDLTACLTILTDMVAILV